MNAPGSTPRKGSRENPLTHEDMPFTVEEGAELWLRDPSGEVFQLPFSPAGSTLDFEVRYDD